MSDVINKIESVWIFGIGGRGRNTVKRARDNGYEEDRLIEIPSREVFDELCETDGIPSDTVIVLVNGLGGKSQYYLPEIIDKLRSEGNVVISVLSLPFFFEGEACKTEALEWRDKVAKTGDVTLVFDNNKLLEDVRRNESLVDVFQKQNDFILKEVVKYINEIYELSLRLKGEPRFLRVMLFTNWLSVKWTNNEFQVLS